MSPAVTAASLGSTRVALGRHMRMAKVLAWPPTQLLWEACRTFHPTSRCGHASSNHSGLLCCEAPGSPVRNCICSLSRPDKYCFLRGARLSRRFVFPHARAKDRHVQAASPFPMQVRYSVRALISATKRKKCALGSSCLRATGLECCPKSRGPSHSWGLGPRLRL